MIWYIVYKYMKFFLFFSKWHFRCYSPLYCICISSCVYLFFMMIIPYEVLTICEKNLLYFNYWTSYHPLSRRSKNLAGFFLSVLAHVDYAFCFYTFSLLYEEFFSYMFGILSEWTSQNADSYIKILKKKE